MSQILSPQRVAVWIRASVQNPRKGDSERWTQNYVCTAVWRILNQILWGKNATCNRCTCILFRGDFLCTGNEIWKKKTHKSSGKHVWTYSYVCRCRQWILPCSKRSNHWQMKFLSDQLFSQCIISSILTRFCGYRYVVYVPSLLDSSRWTTDEYICWADLVANPVWTRKTPILFEWFVQVFCHQGELASRSRWKITCFALKVRAFPTDTGTLSLMLLSM